MAGCVSVFLKGFISYRQVSGDLDGFQRVLRGGLDRSYLSWTGFDGFQSVWKGHSEDHQRQLKTVEDQRSLKAAADLPKPSKTLKTTEDC